MENVFIDFKELIAVPSALHSWPPVGSTGVLDSVRHQVQNVMQASHSFWREHSSVCSLPLPVNGAWSGLNSGVQILAASHPL